MSEETTNADSPVASSSNAKVAKTETAPAKPSEGVLPKVAAHDAAHTWGDSDESRGHDEWLKENRPPHWG